MSRLAKSLSGWLAVTDVFEVGVERFHSRLEKAVVAGIDKDSANAVIYTLAPADSNLLKEVSSTRGV